MTLPRSFDDLQGLRAARWIRESTAGQVDRYGPAAQREQQDRAIARWGLDDTGLAWEVSHSGRTVGSTAQWADMLAAAGEAFDVLLVGYVSRFARNLKLAVNVRDELHAAGAAVLFCDDGILSSDEDSWEHWAREAVEAEAYSRRLARRIRDGYAAKFRLGDQGGSPGLGFARSAPPERRLVIDPTSMPRAVALFRRYAAGDVSYRELAAETGIPADAIRAILANPLYNGWAVRHRRSSREVRAAAPWRSDPPVDDALWARVAEVREQRHTGGGGQARHVHLLAGRLWCVCGRRVKADVNRAKGRVYRRYRHPAPCAAWPAASVGADVLERQVAGQLAGLRLDAAMLARLRALAGQRVAAPDRSALRRKQLEHELEARARAFLRRELTLEALGAEETRIRAELEALAETVPTSEPIRDPDAAIAALRELRTAWRRATPEARRELVASVFERVTVARDRIVEERLTAEARAHGLAVALPEFLALARLAGVGRDVARYRTRIVGRREELAAIRRARSA